MSEQQTIYLQTVTPFLVVDGIKGDTGASGYTPTFGVDYFNGTDGYTPVFGIDYFNGAKGDKGDKGDSGTGVGIVDKAVNKFRVKITPTNPSNVGNVNITIPPLKFNKKFVLTYTGDDGLLGIYSFLQRYVNKRKVITLSSDPYSGLCTHDGRPYTTAITAANYVGSTDGAGNIIPFRFGSAWFTYNNSSVDLHENNNIYLSGMWWSELQTFSDYYGGVYNHEIGNNSNAYKSMPDNENKIYSEIGIYPSIMIRPNGDDTYIDAAEVYDFIKLRTTEGSYKVDYPTPNLFNNIDLYKLTLQRVLLESGNLSTNDLKGMVDTLYSSATSTNVPISNWFHHSIIAGSGAIQFDGLKTLLDYINNTYGAGGNDSIWMPTLDELYEYLYIRENTTITKKVVGNTAVFDIVVNNDANQHFKEFSLLVSGATTASEITDISGEQYGLSTGSTDTELLININYNTNLLTLAEKYLSIAEAYPIIENKQDATFFVNRINSKLAVPYTTRLAALVTITGGTTTTTSTIAPTTTTSTTRHTTTTGSTTTSTTTAGTSKIIVSFGAESYNSSTYSTYNGNIVNFMGYNYYEGYDNFPLKNTNGTVKATFVVKPSGYPTDTTIKCFSDSSGLYPVLTGNTGIYSDLLLKYYEYPLGSNVIGNKSLIRFTGLDAGTYTVNIFSSENNSIYEGQRISCYYQVNTGTPVTPLVQTANNNTIYTTVTGTVAGDGILDFYCYNTGGVWNEPGLNLIEIIK